MSIMIRGDFDETTGTANLDVAGGTSPSCTVDNIPVKGADEITVFVVNGNINPTNGAITGGASTDLDVFVYGDAGAGYASIPIGEMNLGTNSSDILFANTGIYKLRVQIVNNDSHATVINYNIVVKR